MITLYGPARTSAGRCIWCLEEAGVNYENKNVDLRNKEHKADPFLKINPNGKVPALVDGDFIIFESMAINYYIAEKYKPELLGNNANEKSISQQWSFWAATELQPPVIEIFIQKVFMPAEKRSDEIINKNMEMLPGILGVLENALGKNKFLNGDHFTLADLNTASVVSIAPHVGVDMKNYSNINAWLSAMSERPAFKKYAALRNG